VGVDFRSCGATRTLTSSRTPKSATRISKVAARLRSSRYPDQRDELPRRHALQAREASAQSPCHHLLKPKARQALALAVLGDKFDSLDVTIVYPDGRPDFWQFLCGNVPRIVVRARRLPIPPELRMGDYAGDPAFRKVFQHWLEEIWREKDEEIDALAT
jgi:hypothetical protein